MADLDIEQLVDRYTAMSLSERQAFALTHPADDPVAVLASPRWQETLPGGNILSVILAVDR